MPRLLVKRARGRKRWRARWRRCWARARCAQGACEQPRRRARSPDRALALQRGHCLPMSAGCQTTVNFREAIPLRGPHGVCGGMGVKKVGAAHQPSRTVAHILPPGSEATCSVNMCNESMGHARCHRGSEVL
eukprot:5446735-Prymnesium_polylepis.3